MAAEPKYKRIASIHYVAVATEAAEPPYLPRNASRASTTTTALRPAPQHPKTYVFSRLPAAGRHTRRSTANSPPAATPGARAGRTPLAEPKSLPPNTCDTENHAATLVEAIPFMFTTAAPISAATARLQSTQQ